MAQRTRKATTTRKSGGPQPLYIVLVAIALAGVSWIVWSATRGAAMSDAVTEPIPMSMETADLVAAARGVTMGADTAALEVRIFSDFTCPACKNFAERIEPTLIREFVETGRVRFTYHDLPLGGTGQHRHSFISARAARCADDQDRFWEFHDMLFARQPTWSFTDPPMPLFVDYATELGLDVATFTQCLNSDRHADVVSANDALADGLRVNSTPSIFVGMQRVEPSWERIRQAITAQRSP